jgi:hypothetical protein
MHTAYTSVHTHLTSKVRGQVARVLCLIIRKHGTYLLLIRNPSICTRSAMFDQLFLLVDDSCTNTRSDASPEHSARAAKIPAKHIAASSEWTLLTLRNRYAHHCDVLRVCKVLTCSQALRVAEVSATCCVAYSNATAMKRVNMASSYLHVRFQRDQPTDHNVVSPRLVDAT